MITVYKYQLRGSNRTIVEMPKGAKILHVANQDGNPVLWARVDTERKIEERTILLVGTGWPISDVGVDPLKVDPWYYIGTFMSHNSSLVWHVFEELRNGANS